MNESFPRRGCVVVFYIYIYELSDIVQWRPAFVAREAAVSEHHSFRGLSSRFPTNGWYRIVWDLSYMVGRHRF
jgi:hypothetical protein